MRELLPPQGAPLGVSDGVGDVSDDGVGHVFTQPLVVFDEQRVVVGGLLLLEGLALSFRGDIHLKVQGGRNGGQLGDGASW